MNLDCILIVDDDYISTFINQRLLKQLNISQKIVTKKNGKEAFAFMRDYCNNYLQGEFLVLLDLMMPVTDGFEFLSAFKESEFKNKEKVKIRVLTDFVHGLNKQSIDPQEISVVPKPLTKEKLEKIFK